MTIKGNRWKLVGRLFYKLAYVVIILGLVSSIAGFPLWVRFIIGMLLVMATLMTLYLILNDLRRYLIQIVIEDNQMIVTQPPWGPQKVEWDEVAMVLVSHSVQDNHLSRLKVFWNDEFDPDVDFLLPDLGLTKEMTLRHALDKASKRYRFDLHDLTDAQMPDGVL